MTTQYPATGYEPLNTLKPVAEDMWLIDGPAQLRRGMPYPTRCTLIRLGGGDLWVHAPTALTESLRAEITALGSVAHLVAPSRLQFEHIPDWQRAFPEAETYAAPGVAERAAETGIRLTIDHELGLEAPAVWSGQIEQLIVEGSRVHREAVFLHRASETLIVSDLIQNLETSKLPVWMRPLVWIAGTDDSDGKMPVGLRLGFQKEPLADSVEWMIAWQPTRLILSHGRWYRRDAVSELRRAFRRILRDREWTTVMNRIEKDRSRRG